MELLNLLKFKGGKYHLTAHMFSPGRFEETFSYYNAAIKFPKNIGDYIAISQASRWIK